MTDPIVRCSASVREAGRWPRYHQCERKASLTEDGKPWCKTHAPSSVKARQQKATERYEQKWEIERGQYDAPRLREELTEAIRQRDEAQAEVSALRIEIATLRQRLQESGISSD